MPRILIKVFFFSLFISSVSHAQRPSTTETIIEGGRLAVDIVKLFKKDKSETQEKASEKKESKDCKLSVCFKNQSDATLKIILWRIEEEETADKPKTTEIYAIPKGKDCSYSIKEDIYGYKVEDEAGKIYRKAELDFRDCTSVQITVQ